MEAASTPTPSGLEHAPPLMELLVLGYSAENLACLASALRATGQTAQLKTTDSQDELAQLLRPSSIDLAIIDLDANTRLPAERAIELIGRFSPGLPLLFISNTPGNYAELANKHGALNLLKARDYQQQALAIKREHQSLLLRKQLALAEKSLATEKARHRALLHASDDAIAYMHEGMLMEANDAYCGVFGLSADDIPGLSILDLVTREARPGFKEILRSPACMKNNMHAVRCRRLDGQEFNTNMELSLSEIDGEQCVRLIIRTRTTGDMPAAISPRGETASPPPDPLRKGQPMGASPPREYDPADSKLGDAVPGSIDNAIENDRLRLLYQPIVSLDGDTREIYSVAAKILGHHDSVHDEKFLEQVQASGGLAEIDRWAIRRAIQKLAEPQLAARKVNVSMRLSREGMLDSSMLIWICDCLRESKIKGSSLYFEFEYALLEQSPPGLESFLDGLKKINCRFVCRDVNYDSDDHSLLSRQGVEIAQLANSSLPELRNSQSGQERLKRLNTEIRQMGIKIRVDNVQEADTLALLWNMGVNQVQGDFLQVPSDKLSVDTG